MARAMKFARRGGFRRNGIHVLVRRIAAHAPAHAVLDNGGAAGALWTLVPALFYAAPPGQLPLVLAIGHEFHFGTEFGPPLAFWLAEIAYRLAGITGVYFLSQLCIVLAFWAVFALGRAMVGAPQAAMAVMLMAGIAVFSVPTPEFGPAVLATPLWALILLHYWMGATRGTWITWVALGVEAGLLLLTSYAGLILLGLLAVYTAATAFGRAQVETVGPWVAGVAMTAVLFPYLIWLDLSTDIRFLDLATIVANLRTWGWLVVAVLLSHAGMAILIALGRGALMSSRGTSPEVIRAPIHPAARGFVYFFALAPIVAMGLFALFTHRPENFLAAPLVVMSGACGDHRGRRADQGRAPVSDRLRLGRAHCVATARRGVCDRIPALDLCGRSADRAAGQRDGTILRRQLRAPHRAAACGGGR
jgi:hypothetical protein